MPWEIDKIQDIPSVRKKIKTFAKTMTFAGLVWVAVAAHFYRSEKKNKQNI